MNLHVLRFQRKKHKKTRVEILYSNALESDEVLSSAVLVSSNAIYIVLYVQ